jgi:D-xylose 1-dehydrogenase (NADP+, D-xylono-1,5-lactone-forming)
MSSPATAPIRWGVIGTANIAARVFLPALRAAGGQAVVVGSRSAERVAGWATDNGVERGGTYQDVVDADDIDAVYVALPNDQHATWAAAASATGKAVLCEKPLTLDEQSAADLVAATGPEALLWEAFVFPFHPQTTLLRERVGRPHEIHSEFHFTMRSPDNIRLKPELGGGALYDVGCYPVRLARLLFDAEPLAAAGATGFGDAAVDLDVAAVVEFPGERRLVLSAGMRRPLSTFTRIMSDDGELRVSNPFHPTSTDSVELWVWGKREESWVPAPGTAFQYAIEHIHQVLAGATEPRHRAVDDAVGQARALDLIRAATTTN